MTTKKDEPSLVDQLADEVKTKTAFPPGAPELKVMLAIQPRSRRAAFKRRYAEVAEASTGVRKLESETNKIKDTDERKPAAQLRLWAEADDLYQHIIDMLRIAAVDEEKFDVWADEVSDEDLNATFAAYQERAQPGEAPSSTS